MSYVVLLSSLDKGDYPENLHFFFFFVLINSIVLYLFMCLDLFFRTLAVILVSFCLFVCFCFVLTLCCTCTITLQVGVWHLGAAFPKDC